MVLDARELFPQDFTGSPVGDEEDDYEEEEEDWEDEDWNWEDEEWESEDDEDDPYCPI